jgi:hypothetical protein
VAVGSQLGPNVRPSGGPILRASLSLSYGLSDLPWDCKRGHRPQRTASGWIQKGWVSPADCASLLQAGKWHRGGNYHGSHVH